VHPPQRRREGESLLDAHDRREEKNPMTLEGERFPRLASSSGVHEYDGQNTSTIAPLIGSLRLKILPVSS
jgi:hypothetical protein